MIPDGIINIERIFDISTGHPSPRRVDTKVNFKKELLKGVLLRERRRYRVDYIAKRSDGWTIYKEDSKVPRYDVMSVPRLARKITLSSLELCRWLRDDQKTESLRERVRLRRFRGSKLVIFVTTETTFRASYSAVMTARTKTWCTYVWDKLSRQRILYRWRSSILWQVRRAVNAI